MSETGSSNHFLMCPPDHFGVIYEINPWMHREVQVDRAGAFDQWTQLVESLRSLGARVDLLDPQPGDGPPDLVFTANAGVVNQRTFIPARFRHPERQAEEPILRAWFASRGFDIRDISAGLCQEGAGDAIFYRDVLVAGYRWRSDIASHPELSSILKRPVRSVELVDQRFYHLDLAFCPLDSTRALIAPLAFDRYGLAVLKDLVPDPIWLTSEESLAFCANSVVVGQSIVMPNCSERLQVILAAAGFSVVLSPVPEFLKAGGGCRCLTLALPSYPT
jgi:N-dimethylarginine dimethylaminohydrolase